MTSPCNIEAFNLLNSWPEWSFFAICIYGEEGCGKTHLAHVFADKVSRLTNYPYHLPSIKAASLTLENVHEFLERHRCLIVEDLQETKNFEAMFHLYNLYRNEGGNILFTSTQAPARLNFPLADLQSRLNIIPTAEIKTPDDELLSALIIKLFQDRQIMPSPEVVTYILSNMQRSFAYTRNLIETIDHISLAQKRAPNIALVKEAIADLNNNPQADLFD